MDEIHAMPEDVPVKVTALTVGESVTLHDRGPYWRIDGAHETAHVYGATYHAVVGVAREMHDLVKQLEDAEQAERDARQALAAFVGTVERAYPKPADAA